MTAPTIDLFPGQVAPGPTRLDWVTNTPFPKRSERTKPDYYFDEGFYQSTQLPTSHPVEEVAKNERLKRVIDLFKRFNQLFPDFYWVNPFVFAGAVSKLIVLLGYQPFQRVTLEKTPDASLLVKATWCGKDVFIDVDFNTDESTGYEASITAYKDQASVLSVAGPFEFAVNRLLALSQ